jgi:hypothetical protein
MTYITTSEFSERFVALVLGSRELPRKPRALNVLLLSTVLGLEPDRRYSEREINEELQKWVLAFGSGFGLDFVTLRRLLIDAALLRRDPAGSVYELEPAGPRFGYDPSIRSLDLHALITRERESREKRKQAHKEGARTR